MQEWARPEVEVHLRAAPTVEMVCLPWIQTKEIGCFGLKTLTIFWKSKQPVKPLSQHTPFLFQGGSRGGAILIAFK